MLFGFLSRKTTYLKSTEKENINLLTIAIHCTFFTVIRNALINLKWQQKASGNKSGIVEALILKNLMVLASHSQPTDARGGNHVSVLTLHSQLNEELKRYLGSLIIS